MLPARDFTDISRPNVLKRRQEDELVAYWVKVISTWTRKDQPEDLITSEERNSNDPPSSLGGAL
jgi:hypothetical protein